MRRPLAILLAVILAACSSGGSLSALRAYEEIPIGATQQEVVQALGEPRTTKKLDDGSVEYTYVERIKTGSRDTEVKRYRIVLKDGKVVSKKVEMGGPPGYTFDSYEMQTTQN